MAACTRAGWEPRVGDRGGAGQAAAAAAHPQLRTCFAAWICWRLTPVTGIDDGDADNGGSIPPLPHLSGRRQRSGGACGAPCRRPALVTSPRSQQADQARLAGSDTPQTDEMGAGGAGGKVRCWVLGSGSPGGVVGGRDGFGGASTGHGLCPRRLQVSRRTSLPGGLPLLPSQEFPTPAQVSHR